MQGVRSLFKRFCISVSIAVLAVSIAFYNQYVHFVSLGDLVLDEKSVVGGVLPTLLVSVLVLGAMCFLLVRYLLHAAD